MATPLVPGTARVVTSKAAKVESAASANTVQKLPPRSKPSGEEPVGTSSAPSVVAQRLAQATPNPVASAALGVVADNADEIIAKVRASSAAAEIFVSCIGFYIIQFTMWAICVSGVGIEAIPLITGFHIGMAVYTLGLVVILFLGAGTMFYGAIVFNLNGVRCFGGWKGVIFIVCLAAYGIPILNIVPWFVVWIGAVVLLENPREA